MRSLRVLITLFVVGGLLFVPTGASAEEGVVPLGDAIPLRVEGATGAPSGGEDGPEVDCSGFAPQEATCIGQFTVPDVDQFGVRVAIGGPGYTGTIEIQLKSTTGSTTIVCDIAVFGRCAYQQVGPYVVGDTVTLVGVASGFGAWVIQAPVKV